jgi:hypothetical protein
MQRKTHSITTTIVPEASRTDVADKHFGIRFPLTIEPVVYQFASQLAAAYQGGYWEFFQISNGGFLMIPRLDETFDVTADNGLNGTLSAEALGITACLYAYSNLSFGEGGFAEKCAEQYHRLYEYMLTHDQAAAIRAAID